MALIAASVAAAPTPVWSQAAVGPARTARAQALFDAVRQSDYLRVLDRQLLDQQAKIDALSAQHARDQAQLAAERRQRSGNRAKTVQLAQRVDQLERQIVEQQEGYVAEIASRDAQLADRIRARGRDLDLLLQDPDGLRGVQLLNAGRVEEGRAALQKLVQRRQHARDEDAAADARAYASALLDHVPVNENILNYEALTRYPGATFADWAQLSRLYDDKGEAAKALQAGLKAYELAPPGFAKAWAAGGVASRLRVLERNQEAIEKNQEQIRLAGNQGGVESQYLMADGHLGLADAYVSLGQNAAAATNFRESLKLFEAAYAARPTQARPSLMNCLFKYGEFLVEQGDRRSALVLLTRAHDLAMLQRQSAPTDENSAALAYSFTDLAKAHLGDQLTISAADFVATIENLDASFKIYSTLRSKDGNVGRYDLNIQYLYRLYGSAYLKHGDLAKSRTYGDMAISSSKKLAESHPDNVGYRIQYIDNLDYQARIAATSGDFGRDISLSKLEEAQARAVIRQHGHSVHVDGMLANALWRLAAARARGYSWRMVVAQFEAMERADVMTDEARGLLAQAQAYAGRRR